MATVFIHEGNTIPYANTTGSKIAVNTCVLVGNFVGVAITDIADGTSGTLGITGVASLPKATGEAWSQGAVLYWDNTAKKFTTTSTSNTLAGWAYAAALSGDTSGQVKLKIG